MNYQSLLELLAQEDAICRKLQTKINILSAMRQVEEEQKEVPAAQKARREDLQAAAESVIRAELERSGSDGE